MILIRNKEGKVIFFLIQRKIQKFKRLFEYTFHVDNLSDFYIELEDIVLVGKNITIKCSGAKDESHGKTRISKEYSIFSYFYFVLLFFFR